jgi:hypothetical protein
MRIKCIKTTGFIRDQRRLYGKNCFDFDLHLSIEKAIGLYFGSNGRPSSPIGDVALHFNSSLYTCLNWLNDLRIDRLVISFCTQLSRDLCSLQTFKLFLASTFVFKPNIMFYLKKKLDIKAKQHLSLSIRPVVQFQNVNFREFKEFFLLLYFASSQIGKNNNKKK